MTARHALLVLPLAGLLLLAGCATDDADAAGQTAPSSTATPTARPFTVKGTIEVSGHSAGPADPNACTTSGGYDDIQAGAQVEVTDASGTTLALGQLAKGWHPTYDEQFGKEYPGRSVACTFYFNVLDVPLGHDFYGVEVGHRGVVKYTDVTIHDDLALKLG